jgi:SAM-dependent methyltransferase
MGDGSMASAPTVSVQEADNSWEHRYRRARDFLLPWVEQTDRLAGKTILEYGAGHGPVSCAAAELGARVIGVDIDAAIVDDGRELVRAHGATGVELVHHPPETILDAVRALRGEVDMVLLYAVLEHLTLDERLAVLRVAREVLPPDGLIVVCETPNRLTPFDHHTARMPFFHLLPDDLALLYYDRSQRLMFRDAMDEAKSEGPDAARQALLRWGRGVSFHDFELVFDRLSDHVVASNYEPVLYPEREIHPEELVLARYLEEVRPDLAPVWSRQWLDLILTSQPHGRDPKFMRPWPMETVGSPHVSWTRWNNLHLPRPESPLRVSLPRETRRLVVGVIVDVERVTVRVRAEAMEAPIVAGIRGEPHHAHYACFTLPEPARQVEVGLSVSGFVNFVGYEG